MLYSLKKIRDRHTYIRVHEHLYNKKDIITEQDIKAVKTDLSSPIDEVEMVSVKNHYKIVKKN